MEIKTSVRIEFMNFYKKLIEYYTLLESHDLILLTMNNFRHLETNIYSTNDIDELMSIYKDIIDVGSFIYSINEEIPVNEILYKFEINEDVKDIKFHITKRMIMLNEYLDGVINSTILTLSDDLNESEDNVDDYSITDIPNDKILLSLINNPNT